MSCTEFHCNFAHVNCTYFYLQIGQNALILANFGVLIIRTMAPAPLHMSPYKRKDEACSLLQRSAKVVFLGCVTRLWGTGDESRNLGKRL